MYRHFLVPIDSTDLSIEVVGNAVGLARAVGAHITFFHVIVADTEPLRGAAEALRFAPQNARAFTASAGELLAKAEAAARAFGVPCDSKMRGQRPACGGDRRSGARHGLRPGLHGIARATSTRGRRGGGVNDDRRGAECRAAGAGVQRWRPGALGTCHRHDPRRASITGCGAARLDAGAGHGPQCRRCGRPEVDARHRALHRDLSVGAARPEGRRAPVQAPARTHQHGQRRTGRTAAPTRARPPARGRACSAGRHAGCSRRRGRRQRHQGTR